MPLSPQQKTLRAQIAAHTLHSRVDSRAHTERARAAFNERFLNEVDPDRVLPEAERERRAEQARRAYFKQLAFRSSKARQVRRGSPPEAA